MSEEANEEARIRRGLKRNNYRLVKTPARSRLRAYHKPGYMVIDSRNIAVLGCSSREYEADLDDCALFLSRLE